MYFDQERQLAIGRLVIITNRLSHRRMLLAEDGTDVGFLSRRIEALSAEIDRLQGPLSWGGCPFDPKGAA